MDQELTMEELIALINSQKGDFVIRVELGEEAVAVYVGNGKVVEALNESIGVVYRDVASAGKIVVIGRP